MSAYEYCFFLISQAFSEIGDHLWALGLRNFLFENSPWSPAGGLAAIFIIQAIPVFFFAPWLTQSIHNRWRTMALSADLGRLFVTLGFAVFLFFSKNTLPNRSVVFLLLGVQFLLELGTLVFQNCRNCLIPVLYPNPDDIHRAHLWASMASLTAAGVVPLIFIIAFPAGPRIPIDWLIGAAFIDALTFALSGCALLALKRSHRLKTIQTDMPSDSSHLKKSPFVLMAQGLATARRYPAVMQILVFSFFYNLVLMGPFEIGLVTFLRRDLQLPPASLAINLLLFVSGVFIGSLAANHLWKKGNISHMKNFSYSIFLDGVTFFPICFFSLFRSHVQENLFLLILGFLFFAHYTVVPFVRVTRISSIQSLTEKKDWSTLLGFHAIAVEGAAAVSVIVVAFFIPDLSGASLIAWGGVGATLCGLLGIFFLASQPHDAQSSTVKTLTNTSQSH